jgi:hypothetical protein
MEAVIPKNASEAAGRTVTSATKAANDHILFCDKGMNPTSWMEKAER